MRGTLGDAFARGAIPPATTLAQIQVGTAGIRLGELAPFFTDFGVSKLLEGLAASNKTLADLPSLDDMTLGDIVSARAALANVLLEALEGALDGLTFDDVAKAIIDPATGRPVADGSVLADIRQAVSARGSLDQLLFLGDLSVGDLVDAGRELTLGEIEPVLGFVTVKALEDALGIKVDLGTETLGELTADELAHMTLDDLVALAGATSLGDLLTQLDLAGALTGFTLGDLLLALVDPSSLSYGGVEFAQVDVSALPEGTVESATFSADFTMTSGAPRSIELEVALPTSASFVPGTATVQGIPTDPEVDGRTLTWTVPADPGVSYDVEFDVLPSLRLGATSINASARIVGTSVVVPAAAQLTVAEGLEPNDFLPEVVDAQEDFVYLTYISSTEDYDVFGIDVEENDVLVAELSNLDADLDLVLWAEVGAGSSAAALGNVSADAPIIPVTDPDATRTDGESGNDFPRLDEIVAGSGLTGLPELALVATSNSPGTANEFLKSERLAKGRYYIQVYGANGAVTADPAALQLKVIEADPQPGLPRHRVQVGFGGRSLRDSANPGTTRRRRHPAPAERVSPRTALRARRPGHGRPGGHRPRRPTCSPTRRSGSCPLLFRSMRTSRCARPTRRSTPTGAFRRRPMRWSPRSTAPSSTHSATRLIRLCRISSTSPSSAATISSRWLASKTRPPSPTNTTSDPNSTVMS